MGIERHPEETTKRSCLLRKVATGKHSVTLPNVGLFRIHPYIPAFDNLNPSFGAWKREYAVNPETLEIYLRKEGMDEPNKDYVWAANTIITLDFRAAKGTIVVP